jgi:hypothetical protein
MNTCTIWNSTWSKPRTTVSATGSSQDPEPCLVVSRSKKKSCNVGAISVIISFPWAPNARNLFSLIVVCSVLLVSGIYPLHLSSFVGCVCGLYHITNFTAAYSRTRPFFLIFGKKKGAYLSSSCSTIDIGSPRVVPRRFQRFDHIT